MTLVCNICEKKAVVCLNVDCGRFDDNTYFCENHIPKGIVLLNLSETQGRDKEIRRIIFEKQISKEIEENKSK